MHFYNINVSGSYLQSCRTAARQDLFIYFQEEKLLTTFQRGHLPPVETVLVLSWVDGLHECVRM